MSVHLLCLFIGILFFHIANYVHLLTVNLSKGKIIMFFALYFILHAKKSFFQHWALNWACEWNVNEM